MIVLILVVLIIGVVYYFEVQRGKLPVFHSSLTPEPTSKDALSEKWNIFSNKDLRIEFQYPGSWMIKQDSNQIFFVYLNDKDIIIQPETSTTMSFALDKMIKTIDNISYYSDSIISTNAVSKTVKKLTIGGKKAIQISGEYGGEGVMNRGYVKYTFIQLNGRVVTVALNDPAREYVYNKILSTIKFTN